MSQRDIQYRLREAYRRGYIDGAIDQTTNGARGHNRATRDIVADAMRYAEQRYPAAAPARTGEETR